MATALTASQTIGPFFAILSPLRGASLVPNDDPEAIIISGRVLDGAGAPVTDALIEVWQANRHGRYHHPGDTRELLLEADFIGFGRCATDTNGRYSFVTVKPGQVPASDGEAMQAPHIVFAVFARGLLNHLTTRMYFPGDQANSRDPVLNSIEDTAVRETLIAGAAGPRAFTFDIRLQGEGETAFFAV